MTDVPAGLMYIYTHGLRKKGSETVWHAEKPTHQTEGARDGSTVAAGRKLGIRLWIMLRDEIEYNEFCRRGQQFGGAHAERPGR